MLFEIRQYHFNPDLFEAYKQWAKTEAVPHLAKELDVLGFWVNTSDAPELKGEPQDQLGSANVTWIVRWQDLAHRNAVLPGGTRMDNRATAERWMTEKNWVKVEKLQAFSEKHGHSLLELAFSWLAMRPCVASVIAGATKPEQLEANVKAADWKLTEENLAEIDLVTGDSGGAAQIE